MIVVRDCSSVGRYGDIGRLSLLSFRRRFDQSWNENVSRNQLHKDVRRRTSFSVVLHDCGTRSLRNDSNTRRFRNEIRTSLLHERCILELVGRIDINRRSIAGNEIDEAGRVRSAIGKVVDECLVLQDVMDESEERLSARLYRQSVRNWSACSEWKKR